ncbi:hypothetical protein [Ruegeria sp. HKCCD7318]|uniref:hypothetical protein n=1 Tax=Ruegeria sp. HKCCD7318 TaxID=2683014 RepID=UPI00352FFB4B
MANVDASLVQQIFDIPKRERETDVQHNRQADDLGTGFKVFERHGSGHGQKLRNHPARLKQSSSDKTLLRMIASSPNLPLEDRLRTSALPSLSLNSGYGCGFEHRVSKGSYATFGFQREPVLLKL